MRIKRMLIIGSLIMWVFFMGVGSIDVKPNMLTKEHSTDMTDRIKVVKNLNNSYTLSEIIKEQDDIFIPFTESKYRGKLSKQTYWFKLELDKYDENQLIEVSKAQLASVEFYQVDGKGNTLTKDVQGRDYAFNERKFKHRHFVFSSLASSEPTYVYFKVRTDTYLQMPITLWRDTNFINYISYSNLLYGIFYGMILIMLLYNLILGISLKDKNYFLYVALVFSYLFMQLVWDGLAYQYLWPNNPKWDMTANPVFILCLSTTMLAFTHAFLKLQQFKYFKQMYKGILYLQMISFISLLFIPITFAVNIAILLGFISIVYCMAGLTRKKFRETSDAIYAIAVEILLIGGGMNILAGIGVLPYTIITASSTRVGGVLLLLLFSFALSTRIKLIENIKDMETKKREILRGLHDVNRKITGSRDLHEISEYIIKHFTNILNCEDGLIVLFDPNNELDVSIFKSCSLAWSIKLNEDNCNHIHNYIGTAEISYSKGFEFDYLDIKPDAHVVIVPLINEEGPTGAIVLFTDMIPVIDTVIEELILDYANQITLNIGNIKYLDEVTKTARTDDLTQIHNRRYIFEIASTYFSPTNIKNPLAIIMLDIDHFKQINDKCGHAVGDQLMEKVAQHIKAIINGKGELGRYGGDEFIVVVPNMTRKRVWELAEDICSNIYSKEYSIEDQNVNKFRISVSIGVAYRDKEDQTIERICENGDKALYSAKKSGRNQVAVYDELSQEYSYLSDIYTS